MGIVILRERDASRWHADDALAEVFEDVNEGQGRCAGVQTRVMRCPIGRLRAQGASASQASGIGKRPAHESRGRRQSHGGPRGCGKRNRSGAIGAVGTNWPSPQCGQRKYS